MSVNPELRRNLWLEATPARLVLLPAVLVGVLFLAFVADGRRLGGTTSVSALVGLGLLTWGWGAHLASESVLSELRGRTWDWQRMSGQGAWTLTWGKLLGATSPTWYGGAVCLVAYALATSELEEGRGWKAALVVLAGVLAQAGAFLGALQQASRGRAPPRARSAVALVAAAVLVLQVITSAVPSSRAAWYGVQLAPVVLGTLSVGAFALFALVGAWVAVRRELRIRTLSVAWPSFLLFLMVWAAGFAVGGEEGGGGRPALAFLVAVAATWATALLDPRDPVALARLVRAAREGRWRTLAEDLPPWILGLPFVLGALVVVAVAPPALGAGDARTFTAAVALFLLRDLAVVVLLTLRAPARGTLLALVLFGVGYVLVPLVLSASGARGLASAFFPDPERGGESAAAALVQAVTAGWLLSRRWRARTRALDAGEGP